MSSSRSSRSFWLMVIIAISFAAGAVTNSNTILEYIDGTSPIQPAITIKQSQHSAEALRLISLQIKAQHTSQRAYATRIGVGIVSVLILCGLASVNTLIKVMRREKELENPSPDEPPKIL